MNRTFQTMIHMLMMYYTICVLIQRASREDLVLVNFAFHLLNLVILCVPDVHAKFMYIMPLMSMISF